MKVRKGIWGCGRRGACVATVMCHGKTYGGPAQAALPELKTPNLNLKTRNSRLIVCECVSAPPFIS